MSYSEIANEYKKLKLKIEYNKKLISNYENDFLQEIEEKIYGDISESNKVTYELEILKSGVSNLPEEKKNLYSKIMKLILLKLDSSNVNYSEIKKLIVAAEMFYNLDYGFYTSIKDINVENLVSELEEKGKVR